MMPTMPLSFGFEFIIAEAFRFFISWFGSGLRSNESAERKRAARQKEIDDQIATANRPPTPEEAAAQAAFEKAQREKQSLEGSQRSTNIYTGGRPMGRAANILTGAGGVLDEVVSAKRQLLGL